MEATVGWGSCSHFRSCVFHSVCAPRCSFCFRICLFSTSRRSSWPKCNIYVNVRQILPCFFYILPQFCSRSIAINASGGHRRGRGQEGRGSRTRGGRGVRKQLPSEQTRRQCRCAVMRQPGAPDEIAFYKTGFTSTRSLQWNGMLQQPWWEETHKNIDQKLKIQSMRPSNHDFFWGIIRAAQNRKGRRASIQVFCQHFV